MSINNFWGLYNTNVNIVHLSPFWPLQFTCLSCQQTILLAPTFQEELSLECPYHTCVILVILHVILMVVNPNNRRSMGMITLLKLGIQISCHNYEIISMATFKLLIIHLCLFDMKIFWPLLYYPDMLFL